MEAPVDLDEVRRILRDHGVVFAYLHGSHADGTATAASDVDIAVAGEMDVWALRGALPDRVDLLPLDEAPDLLRGRVATRGTVLLDDDPPARVRWEAHWRKVHADERFRRERYRREFAAAAREVAADG